MEQVSRVWFTPQQRAELWERWTSGQCIAAIARTLGQRNKSGVYRVLAVNGGIMPVPRQRARLALTASVIVAITTCAATRAVSGEITLGRWPRVISTAQSLTVLR
jgi:hypothetical protein